MAERGCNRPIETAHSAIMIQNRLFALLIIQFRLVCHPSLLPSSERRRKKPDELGMNMEMVPEKGLSIALLH